tara:strand:+ start:47037 stop:48167 length:1131 start_codon:yes stop_codon:yes gene_type:complete
MSRKVKDISLKLKAPQNVRIRAGVPEANSNNLKGYLHKDFTVDLVEEWVGENHTEGGFTSDKWYKDKNEDFYWSGGFEKTIEPITVDKNTNTATNKDWWFDDYSIEKIWLKLGNKGDGVKVCILDTGYKVKHQSFNGVNIDLKNSNDFTGYNSIDDLDKYGHGTACFGILAANGYKSISGIAPNAIFMIGRINATKSGGIRFQRLLDALRFYKSKANIISISGGIKKSRLSNDEIAQLKNEIDNCLSNNCIVVAAIGNSKDRTDGDLPADFENVISVGAIDKESKLCPKTIKSKNLDICAPGVDMYSTSTQNEFDYFNGTSFATPFITGLCTLMISNKKTIRIDQINEKLVSFCDPFKPHEIEYRRLNKEKLINNI